MRPEVREQLFGATLGPQPSRPDAELEKLYDAIREVRASKTPSTWTAAERALFAMLPETK